MSARATRGGGDSEAWAVAHESDATANWREGGNEEVLYVRRERRRKNKSMEKARVCLAVGWTLEAEWVVDGEQSKATT